MAASFRFTSQALTVQFEGTEEFVAKQIALLLPRIRRIMVGEAVAQAADLPAPKAPETTLESVYANADIRSGRGALQDSILVFAHYLLKKQGKLEFSIEDLNFCFDLLEQPRPKSLANTLGILKRDRRLLHPGSRRGTYTLSDRGSERVRRIL